MQAHGSTLFSRHPSSTLFELLCSWRSCRCCLLLPQQSVRVDEILGAEKAKEVIEEAIQLYVDSYVPKKYRVTK